MNPFDPHWSMIRDFVAERLYGIYMILLLVIMLGGFGWLTYKLDTHPKPDKIFVVDESHEAKERVAELQKKVKYLETENTKIKGAMEFLNKEFQRSQHTQYIILTTFIETIKRGEVVMRKKAHEYIRDADKDHYSNIQAELIEEQKKREAKKVKKPKKAGKGSNKSKVDNNRSTKANTVKPKK